MTESSVFKKTSKDKATHRSYPCRGRRFIAPIRRGKGWWSGIFFSKRFDSLRLWISMLAENNSEKEYFVLSDKYASCFEQIVGNENLDVAVYRGTPGPYSKDVALLAFNEQPKWIVKIATTTAAKAMIRNEFEQLKRLESAPVRAPSVKGIVEVGSQLLLVQSLVNAKSIVRSKHLQHVVNCICELAQYSAEIDSFPVSNMLRVMQERFIQLSGKLDDSWSDRIQAGFGVLLKGFGDDELLLTLAHRDMVPWNMRIDQNKRIHLFDWEYSASGYVPLYDYFHFLLMPKVLSKGVTEFDARQAVAKIQKIRWSDKTRMSYKADLQLLAYALDICIFYLYSRDGECPNDSIMHNGYARIIDDFQDRLT